ncbi:MAG: hypothetical protein U5M23_01370 [Marinagarivorans sp.]|nr:hypothetical protein [Marinagarivorans sp.]
MFTVLDLLALIILLTILAVVLILYCNIDDQVDEQKNIDDEDGNEWLFDPKNVHYNKRD